MRRFIPALLAATIGIFLQVKAQHGPESAVRGTKRFRKSVVVSGLANPWEVTWGPDGMLWVTERSGKRVTRINPANGERSVALTVDEASAPGGQDGVLGLALHPELLRNTGNNHVYLSYTYIDKAKGPDPEVTDPNSRYRYLYTKVVRLTYDPGSGTLSNSVDVITGLPAGNDHVAGRLKIGPDGKLYITLGDQGHNQFGNMCMLIESQRLPTAKELAGKDYASYVGKTLRINPDGSVPSDNPQLNGVVSHVYTYGHRNTQGIDFAPDGTLYGAEHGPKTDDEVNILVKGGNYGWPHVAGFRDNKAYEYARWADAKGKCSELTFSDLEIHPSVPREPESAFTKPIVEPLATLFTVPSNFNFHDRACEGIDFICWPTVAVSSIEHYQGGKDAIPGWDRVLLVTTLKRGSLYVVPLDRSGKSVSGPIARYFQSENRFRDTVVSPDKKTIYIATDVGGVVEGLAGGVASKMQDRGTILGYTYEGEGTGNEPAVTSQTRQPDAPQSQPTPVANGVPPQFTAAQAVAGKTAYNTNCAVCHGNNLMNGAMGTPLAGPYFRKVWTGRTVGAFYERARKTMPPAAPGSLPAETYANITAWIFELNGFKPGAKALPPGGDALNEMVIKQ